MLAVSVSIQLGSPASGDELIRSFQTEGFIYRFHSIGIPSEWGLELSTYPKITMSRFHSIGIPSEWGHIAAYSSQVSSIFMFPFNWDPQRVGTKFNSVDFDEPPGFHSIGIPSEWGLGFYLVKLPLFKIGFPFNWDPQRVGTSV